MMTDLIKKVARGQVLSEDEAAAAMRAIMRGEATPAQIAGFAMALAVRGETVDEIVGMARTAREFAVPVPMDSDVLDTCGTGGDGLGTFNISTGAAIVAAACGVRVAKHGNRSASSRCGSADVLEELGVRIDLGPEQAARCLDKVGITFLFAQVFHPSFKHAAGPRRELGTRTVFNLIGPLANPARARFQIVGVPNAGLVPMLAEVLSRLGVARALVFHSDDGMDELSTSAPASAQEVFGGKGTPCRIDPAELDLPPARIADLAGGDRAVNVTVLSYVLAGHYGPARDVVVLNAAAALLVAGRAHSWREGMRSARQAIDSGAAAELLRRWSVVSQELHAESLVAQGVS